MGLGSATGWGIVTTISAAAAVIDEVPVIKAIGVLGTVAGAILVFKNLARE